MEGEDYLANLGSNFVTLSLTLSLQGRGNFPGKFTRKKVNRYGTKYLFTFFLADGIIRFPSPLEGEG
jgi:hypothetical protein